MTCKFYFSRSTDKPVLIIDCVKDISFLDQSCLMITMYSGNHLTFDLFDVRYISVWSGGKAIYKILL